MPKYYYNYRTKSQSMFEAHLILESPLKEVVNNFSLWLKEYERINNDKLIEASFQGRVTVDLDMARKLSQTLINIQIEFQ